MSQHNSIAVPTSFPSGAAIKLNRIAHKHLPGKSKESKRRTATALLATAMRDADAAIRRGTICNFTMPESLAPTAESKRRAEKRSRREAAKSAATSAAK